MKKSRGIKGTVHLLIIGMVIVLIATLQTYVFAEVEGSASSLSDNDPAVVSAEEEQKNSGETSATKQEIIIKEILMSGGTVEEGDSEVKLPLTVDYASSGDASLSSVPVSVSVNDVAAERSETPGYIYSWSLGGQNLELYFAEYNGEGTENEALYVKEASGKPLAVGEYVFSLTVPGENMESGEAYSFDVNFAVLDIDVPISDAGQITPVDGGVAMIYNGGSCSLSTQKGVHFNWLGSGTASIEGYYIDEGTVETTTANSGAAGKGKAPVNAGTYYARVTVASDGVYSRVTAYIPFTIYRADLVVQSVPNVSPISPGNSLANAKIYNGVVAIAGTNTTVSGDWRWVDTTLKPTASGSYAAKFTPSASQNFNELGEQMLKVTVAEIQEAYTVYYKPGAGSGTMTNGTAFGGTPFTLPACGFKAPTGKEFSGWSINGTTYAAGATYVFTANTNVTALWKDISANHTHTGGVATCASPATCSSCGLTYGSKNSSNHKGNTEVRNRVEATATANGYTGDTWCLGCQTKIATGTVIKAGTIGTSSNSSGGSSVYGAKNTVKPQTSVSGTTATISALSQAEVTSILTDNTANNVTTFDVSGMGTVIDTVNLSRNNLKSFAEASNNGGLRVNMSTGSVKLDQKALKTVVEQSDGDTIRLVLNNAGTSLLNENQKKSTQSMQLHGAAEIYFLSVKDNKRISDLNGGMMTVSVPFSVPSGLSSAGFLVWYIDDSGTRTKLTSWYEGYKLHWQVGHNSSFIISYGSAGTTNTTTTVKSPKTGDLGLDTLMEDFTAFMVVALVIPVAVIVGIGWRLRKRSR